MKLVNLVSVVFNFPFAHYCIGLKYNNNIINNARVWSALFAAALGDGTRAMMCSKIDRKNRTKSSCVAACMTPFTSSSVFLRACTY